MGVAYLVDGHESPEEDADLLAEGDHVDRVRQVGELRVDDVLEELAHACIEGVQVDTPVDDSHEPEVLIYRQVFHQLLVCRLTSILREFLLT